jgi:alpha-L-rhamnosidase
MKKTNRTWALALLACAAVLTLQPLAARADATITPMKTEGNVNPLGVEAPLPRFSWLYSTPERGFLQSAYRILVASTPEKLNAGVGDLWDSGKVRSATTTNVPYAGAALKSTKRYFWNITGYDAHDKAIRSDMAFFEMGLLSNADWGKARWIASRLTAPNTVPVQSEQWTDYTIETGFRIKEKCANVIFRAQFISDVRYTVQIEPDTNGTIKVFKKPDGQSQLLKQFDAGKPILPDTDHTLKVVVSGSTFEISLDGAVVGTVNDSSLPTGCVGVGAYGDDGAWGDAIFDNFKVYTKEKTLFEDDFNDGALNNFQDIFFVGGGQSQPENGTLHVHATNTLAEIKKDLQAPLFRKAFPISKTVKSARAYVSGIGYYEMTINGRKVGDRLLEPGYSRYDKRIYYSVYDIKNYLAGQNVVGFELGRGWYSFTTPTLWGDYRAKDWISEPKLKALLKIEYADGSVDEIVTDGSFKTASGPILFDSLKAGEIYDARKEIAGWGLPAFDDRQWRNALLAMPPIETNLAKGKTVTASSALNAWGWAPQNAVDGERKSTGLSMGYHSDQARQEDPIKWVALDLGKVCDVFSLRLYPRSDQPGGSFPVDYNIQISATGGSEEGEWKTIKEVRGGSTDNAPKTVTLDAGAKTQFIRVQGVNMSGTNFALAEFEVYGDETSDANPGLMLHAQMFPPIREVEKIKAVSVKPMGGNAYAVDFGKHMAGNVELKVSGKAGDKVRMQYAERAGADGVPIIYPFAPTATGCYQQDTYILKGEGEETFQAKFSYNGFRYLIVTGFPGVPTPANFTAKVINSDMRSTGTFESSSALLNAISRAARASIQSNMHSIPTDCPTFEKLGWTCDDAGPMEAMVYYFDIQNLYEKRMNDYSDDISPDGAVSDVLPSTWGLKGSDPAWNGSIIAIPWKMYCYYGTKTILAEHYADMKKYLDWLTQRANRPGKPAFIVSPDEDSGYGDWAPPDHKGGRGPEGVSLYQTVYYYWYSTLMRDIAAVLGKTADSKAFEAQALNIKKAINDRYFDEKENAYFFPNKLGGFRQAAQVLPLEFDLVPPGKEKLVAARLAADVKERGNHFWVGILGFEFIADVLTKYGYADLAYEGNLKTDFPSIGNMITEGATTLWESYSLATTRSLNHKMYATIAEWLFRSVAGLGVDESAPGFTRAVMAPVPCPEKLTFAKASYDSVSGKYQSGWEIANGRYFYTAKVPPNAKARVVIPGVNAANAVVKEGENIVWKEGHFVNGTKGVYAAQKKGANLCFEVGSGDYRFTFDPAVNK